MTHIANQRIRKGGKSYAPGDSIDMTEAELAELPVGAVSEKKEFAATVAETAVKLVGALTSVKAQQSQDPDGRADRLKAAVAALSDADFKKDGQIRADSLKGLVDRLGFEVTAEEVTEIRPGGENT